MNINDKRQHFKYDENFSFSNRSIFSYLEKEVLEEKKIH